VGPAGPAQPSNLNYLTESGTQNLPTHSQAFPPESVPPARDNDLCVECGYRPHAAAGQLSRCIPCIKAEAARARDARKAADARVSKTKVVKPRSPQRMETAELREYIRKITPELIKGLVEVAETSGCEKAREDAAKVLTSRGYVRTAKTSGQEINISWRLKK